MLSQFLLPFCYINKNVRFNNLKIRADMNEKFSVFVICIGVIIYLLLCNTQDCTFKRFLKLSNPSLHLLFVLIELPLPRRKDEIIPQVIKSKQKPSHCH